MGISIENFVKLYKQNSKAKESTLVDFLKKHIKTEYVDVMTKQVICESIVKATTHVKDGDRELVKVNSFARYIFFAMKLIELYTDIEININGDGDLAKYYDELSKVGAIIMLITGIPEKGIEFIPFSEYQEFKMILDMCIADFEENEYSLTALLYNFKQSLSLSEEVITSAIEQLTKTENE